MGVFCCLGILWLLVPKIIEDRQKRHAVEREARRLSTPGYRHRNMLRILNGDLCDIKRLQINYDGKSVVVEGLRTDQMFRHLIETNYPVEVEYIYSYIDGKEYRIKESVFQPPGEIAIMLKRNKIEGRALGPIEPNEKIGLSPVKPIVIKWWEME